MRVISAHHDLLATLKHLWKSFKGDSAVEHHGASVSFFNTCTNPLSCQAEVTETVASTDKLIYTRTEEVELENLDLRSVVLKFCITHENFQNLVDQEVQFAR
jgi:hypothetical protein